MEKIYKVVLEVTADADIGEVKTALESLCKAGCITGEDADDPLEAESMSLVSISEK